MPIASSSPLGVLASPWVAYTPTISPSAGAFTTASAAGRYKQVGKTCFFTVNIEITDVGTASGYINLALPNSLSSNANFHAGGVNGSTGEALTLKTYGSNTATLFKYTGAFPGTTGQVLTVSGFFETT